MLVSTSLEFNSMLCGYKGGEVNRPGAIRHVFSHHAYSIPYTALENNPVGFKKTSGTLQGLFHTRIKKARQWALKPVEREIEDDTVAGVFIHGERDAGTEVFTHEELESDKRRFLLIEGSSIHLDLKSSSVDFIVTDPPYFDNVQYSDLAAFFRVWLKKMVPGEHRWEYDLCGSAVDPQANGNGQYTGVLSGIFSECYRVLKKDGGRLIFTFHHWNPKAWAALTIALQQAEFQLVNRYVVQAENPTSVHINGLKSLEHDAILVLAPVGAGAFTQWQPVNTVNKNGSFKFCEDCASALGWILQQNTGLKGIEGFWSGLI
jgi:adenine-specific DNA methylase